MFCWPQALPKDNLDQFEFGKHQTFDHCTPSDPCLKRAQIISYWYKNMACFKTRQYFLVSKPTIYIWLELFVGPFVQLKMPRNGRYGFWSYNPRNAKKLFLKVVPCFSMNGTRPGKRNPHETQNKCFKLPTEKHHF